MKTVKLNRIEKALVALANHIDANQYNQYKVRQEILDILGLDFVSEEKSSETTR